MHRRWLVLLLAMYLAWPAGAAAQGEEGVVIDPDSPSGKEYAIPLEAARRQADPGRAKGQKVEQGSYGSPVFGEGIQGEASTRDPSTGDEGRSGSSGATGGSAAPDSRPPAPGGDAAKVIRAAASRPGAPPADGGTSLLVGGGAALLLLLGGLAGWRLRGTRAVG